MTRRSSYSPPKTNWIKAVAAGATKHRSRIAILGSTATIGASNFGFHILGTRLLGPSRYGALGALLNLIILLDVPVTAIQAAVTQSTAEAVKRTQATFPGRQVIIMALSVGAAAAVIIGALTPVIDDFLHLSSSAPTIFLAGWMIPTTLTAAIQGLLIGQERFKEAALSLSIGTGVVRLLAGALLMFTVGGVSGAMAGTLLGQLVAVGSGFWYLRSDILRAGSDDDRIKIHLADGVLSLAALGGVAVFGAIDTLLARHYLAYDLAGNYAAAVNIGRMALFLSSAFSIIAFPVFVSLGGSGPMAMRALKRALIGLLAVSGITAAVLAAIARPLTEILFGQKYPIAPSAVGPIAYSATSFAAVGLLTYFHISRRSKMAFGSLLGVGILSLLIVVAHRSVREIAFDCLLSSSAVAVLMGVAAFSPLKIKGDLMRNDIGTK